jgi:hypothetical protein
LEKSLSEEMPLPDSFVKDIYKQAIKHIDGLFDFSSVGPAMAKLKALND